MCNGCNENEMMSIDSIRKPTIGLLFEFSMLWGGERSLLAVLPLLKERFDFVAIGPDKGLLAEQLAELEIPILALDWRDADNKKLPVEKIQKQIIEVLAGKEIGLLHANSLTGARTLGPIASELSCPVTAHIRDIFGLSKTAMRNINGCDRLIAVSNATKEFHVAQGLDEAKTDVIYNGINFEEFQPRDANGFLHRELNLPESKKFAILIAQIGLRKGHDILAEAAVEVAEEIPDWHFVIVGKRGSISQECIDFEVDFQERFREAGLGDRLHLLGERHDVAALMNESHLLVHPAKQEPLGRVLLEAAASGLPILATHVGGTSEIVQNGESARLVPANDSTAFANGLLELASDEVIRKKFSTRVLREIRQKFSIEESSGNLSRCWLDVIDQFGV